MSIDHLTRPWIKTIKTISDMYNYHTIEEYPWDKLHMGYDIRHVCNHDEIISHAMFLSNTTTSFWLLKFSGSHCTDAFTDILIEDLAQPGILFHLPLSRLFPSFRSSWPPSLLRPYPLYYSSKDGKCAACVLTTKRLDGLKAIWKYPEAKYSC